MYFLLLYSCYPSLLLYLTSQMSDINRSRSFVSFNHSWRRSGNGSSSLSLISWKMFTEQDFTDIYKVLSLSRMKVGEKTGSCKVWKRNEEDCQSTLSVRLLLILQWQIREEKPKVPVYSQKKEDHGVNFWTHYSLLFLRIFSSVKSWNITLLPYHVVNLATSIFTTDVFSRTFSNCEVKQNKNLNPYTNKWASWTRIIFKNVI